MSGYNFTQGVREALSQARVEAMRLHHGYVGTEHEVLGLIGVGDNIATRILRRCGVRADDVRHAIEDAVTRGSDRVTTPDMPYTSRAKKALELAMKEARLMGHTHVDTGHLLIGILAERGGMGGELLAHAGLDLDDARSALADFVNQSMPDGAFDNARFTRPLAPAAAANMLVLMSISPEIAKVFAKHEIDLPTLIDDVRNAGG